MTLPAQPRDWPEDARHEWLERVAMRLEQWGGKPDRQVVVHHEREAEQDVRRDWQARGRSG